jgi:hypothetical protein
MAPDEPKIDTVPNITEPIDCARVATLALLSCHRNKLLRFRIAAFSRCASNG